MDMKGMEWNRWSNGDIPNNSTSGAIAVVGNHLNLVGLIILVVRK